MRAVSGFEPARSQRAGDDQATELAKGWILQLVERSSLEEVGRLPLPWLTREVPEMIREILQLLREHEPGSPYPEGLLRRVAELRNLREGLEAPAELPRDVAALHSLLVSALHREVPDPRVATSLGPSLERLAGLFGEIQSTVTEALVRERSGEARRDPLTGLAGAEEMHEWIAILLADQRRYGRPFAVLVIDIDGLKRINDAYGREAGDRILGEVGGMISRQTRIVDPAFRIDDDEFCVLVPNHEAAQGEPLARRLIAVIEQSQIAEGPRIGISIGLAACPEHGNTAERLLEVAQEATYRAKAAGAGIAIGSDDGHAILAPNS